MVNLGVMVWILKLNLAFAILFGLVKVLSLRFKGFSRLVEKLAGYFCYNGVIRLLLECLMDLALCSVLNVV